MIGLTRDLVKLTTLFRDQGLRHAAGIALLAIRARLMRHSDEARERSMGLVFNDNIVDLDLLRIASPNKQHGFAYVPCTGIAVRTLLDNIATDLSRYCFIDFGSGEGRSLIVASTYQFDQVLGIEFAEELHETAERNIATTRLVASHKGKLQSIHADAALFDIPRRDCVLYFYNPFDETVFRAVLKNIERAYRDSCAQFYIIFHQTRSMLEEDDTSNAELLRTAPFLKQCTIRFRTPWHRFLLGSQDLYIFRTMESTGEGGNTRDHSATEADDSSGVPWEAETSTR